MNSSSLRDTLFKSKKLAEKHPNTKIYCAHNSSNYENF